MNFNAADIPSAKVEKRRIGIFWGLLLLAAWAAPAFAGGQYPFSGHYDLVDRTLSVGIDLGADSRLKLELSHAGRGHHQFTLEAEHLRLLLFEITTQLHGVVDVVENPPGPAVVQGSLWSEYSLVNGKNVRELSGRFEIKDQTFYLHDLQNLISLGK